MVFLNTTLSKQFISIPSYLIVLLLSIVPNSLCIMGSQSLQRFFHSSSSKLYILLYSIISCSYLSFLPQPSFHLTSFFSIHLLFLIIYVGDLVYPLRFGSFNLNVSFHPSIQLIYPPHDSSIVQTTILNEYIGVYF